MISLELRTKPYVHAYLISQMGAKPVMNGKTNIGAMLLTLLQRAPGKNDLKMLSRERYSATTKVYISKHTYGHSGCHITDINLRAFNLYVEQELKKTFRTYMDMFILINPSFHDNLPGARKHIGVDFEDWNDDSIRKDYYRYRKAAGLPGLYKK